MNLLRFCLWWNWMLMMLLLLQFPCFYGCCIRLVVATAKRAPTHAGKSRIDLLDAHVAPLSRTYALSANQVEATIDSVGGALGWTDGLTEESCEWNTIPILLVLLLLLRVGVDVVDTRLIVRRETKIVHTTTISMWGTAFCTRFWSNSGEIICNWLRVKSHGGNICMTKGFYNNNKNWKMDYSSTSLTRGHL